MNENINYLFKTTIRGAIGLIFDSRGAIPKYFGPITTQIIFITALITICTEHITSAILTAGV